LTGNRRQEPHYDLAPHAFVRPIELRHAEWSEFDFDAAVWTVPAAKMKMRPALSSTPIRPTSPITEVTASIAAIPLNRVPQGVDY
jgi:integrase